MPTLEEVKAKQQVMWGSGDYSKIAWVTHPFGDVLVEAADVRPGARVLDVATGTGHVALAAARRFGETTGIDYVPSLLEHARRRAEVEGLTVDFREGDAENIPFADGTFDYVLSSVGAMFAPDQQRAADELIRVAKPGGLVAMINWTPGGYLGELFRLISRYVPPPENVQPPPMWGDEEHVRRLFGDRANVAVKPGSIGFYFESAAHFADFFITHYGPTLKAFETLDAESRELFRADLVTLTDRFNLRQDGALTIDCAYLIVFATKA